MNPVRKFPYTSRAGRLIGSLTLAVMVLAACSMPQFGGEERAAAEFEATPYVAGESVRSAAAAGSTESSNVEQPALEDPASVATEMTATPAEGAAAPPPTPEAVALVAGSAPSTYTAEVVAKNRVNVMAEVSGMVLNLIPEVGDRVAAGDLLVEVDGSTLEAQRAQALAGLEAAQAQLDLVLDQVEPEAADVEAAQAAVNAAAAAYTRALEARPKKTAARRWLNSSRPKQQSPSRRPAITASRAIR